MQQVPTTLVVICGLPGCGKTSLAREIARHFQIPLFAKDRIQRVLYDQVAGADAVDGYHVLLDQAGEQLSLGVSCVLDAVFPMRGFRQQALDTALQYGARFRPIHCHCSDEALWRARMADREQLVPGWPPVGWAEVERLRPQFVQWHALDVLELDSVEPLQVNVQRALRFIERNRTDS